MPKMQTLPWLKEVCTDSICGGALGIVKGTFGVTTAETEEIASLKKLALDSVSKNASPEAVAAGVVTAAELVCSKTFKHRFTEVLMGACLNLVG